MAQNPLLYIEWKYIHKMYIYSLDRKFESKNAKMYKHKNK